MAGRIFRKALSALVCGLIAQAATAQSASVARSSPADIVVNGRHDPYRRDLHDVRAITVRHDGQIARFQTEICPLVVGLPRSYGEAIEKRIRGVARTVGLSIGKTKCPVDFTVIVADDPVATIAALRKTRPSLFDTMAHDELQRVDHGKGPAWSWYAIDPKRRDGGPVEHISEIAIGGPPEPTSKHAYIVHDADLSLTSTPVRLDITSSFIVIRGKAVEGLTLDQIGDFAAMLGLSSVDYERITDLRRDSVLHVLEEGTAPAERPQAATAFDLAYLKSLYSGDPGLSFDQQSARMATSMERSALAQK